jgi:hypothetical protein
MTVRGIPTIIGSKISSRFKKNVSSYSKMLTTSVLLHDSKASKVSAKDNPHDSYHKNVNHAFLTKPEFEG